MSSALTVDLNRDRLHDVAATNTYTTDEAFYVALENHGEAVHIHLHLDDTLSTVATLDGSNHYVDAGETTTVRVDVDPNDEPVTGKLKIVTGYGAETAYIDVTVEPYEEEKHVVQVDEDLAKPQRRERQEREPSLSEQFSSATSSGNRLPLVAFAGFAILLALAIGVIVDSSVVLVGVGVVIGGVLAALALQMR